MSSAGQPENNDLSRDRFEAQMRHPAAGASRPQPPRAARRNRLRLPGSQRNVLAAIQNELQADAELTAGFSAFASVTSGTAMPKTERLPAWSALAGRRRLGRAFLNWRIMLGVAVMASFAGMLAWALAASSPGGQQARCEPAYGFAPACQGSSWAPTSVRGQLGLPYRPDGRPPAYSRP